jgi:hypothetical protein
MSDHACEHDATTYDVDQDKLAKYMKEGTDLLYDLDDDVAFASDDRRPSNEQYYDKQYWENGGDWSRNANVNILVPKAGVDPSEAVNAIFLHPENWRLDCSQFVQVVTLYGWLRLLGAKKFNNRARHCGGDGIKIAPFKGSVFSRPQRNYWRRTRKHWMTDTLDTGRQPRLTVREIIDAAPVGSRVLFRNGHPDALNTFFLNENVLKVGYRTYVGHPFGETKEQDLILALYQNTPGKGKASLAEAHQYVWIKEVTYHLDLVTYTRAQKRLRLIRAATRATRHLLR